MSVSVTLSPVARQLFLNPSTGAPGSGFKLFTYAAGTTTKLATYLDSIGNTPNQNPILMDTLGECDLWLQTNVPYKLVFAYPTDTDPPTNPIWTRDNVSANEVIDLAGAFSFPTTTALLSAFSVSVSLTDGSIALTSGRTAEGDRGGATFFYQAGDTTTPDNGGTVRVDGAGRRWYAIVVKIPPELFGAAGNGTTDDVAAIQAAHNALVSQGGGSLALGPRTYKCGGGLTFNVAKVLVTGTPGTVLNFSTISTSSVGITYTGNNTGAFPFHQSAGGIDGVEIVGPGTIGTSIGIYESGTAQDGPSNSNIRNCNINNWAVGGQVGPNAYLISHYETVWWDCGVGFSMPAGQANSGEGIKFYGGSIHDCLTKCFDLNSSTADVGIYGTSLDSTPIGIYHTQGFLYAVPHFEALDRAYQSVIGAGAPFATIIPLTCFQAAGMTDPLFDVGSNCYLTLMGGFASPNNATAPVVKIGAGSRYVEIEVGWDYSGSTLRTLDPASKYFIVNANNSECLTNYSMTCPNLVVTNGKMVTQSSPFPLTSLSVPYPLGFGIVQGVIEICDETSGGNAIFSLNTTVGAKLIGTNDITGLQVPSFTASDWNLEITSGTAPRILTYGFRRIGL